MLVDVVGFYIKFRDLEFEVEVAGCPVKAPLRALPGGSTFGSWPWLLEIATEGSIEIFVASVFSL